MHNVTSEEKNTLKQMVLILALLIVGQEGYVGMWECSDIFCPQLQLIFILLFVSSN